MIQAEMRIIRNKDQPPTKFARKVNWIYQLHSRLPFLIAMSIHTNKILNIIEGEYESNISGIYSHERFCFYLE